MICPLASSGSPSWGSKTSLTGHKQTLSCWISEDRKRVCLAGSSVDRKDMWAVYPHIRFNLETTQDLFKSEVNQNRGPVSLASDGVRSPVRFQNYQKRVAEIQANSNFEVLRNQQM